MKKKAVSIHQEDYLERIHELISEKGYARVSDIARALGLGRPSVTVMVQQLGRKGYLNYEKYRGITLTARGEKVAEGIRARHRLLSELFAQLGIGSKRALQDIEGIEHHLSAPTVAKLEQLVEHLRRHPLARGGNGKPT